MGMPVCEEHNSSLWAPGTGAGDSTTKTPSDWCNPTHRVNQSYHFSVFSFQTFSTADLFEQSCDSIFRILIF